MLPTVEEAEVVADGTLEVLESEELVEAIELDVLVTTEVATLGLEVVVVVDVLSVAGVETVVLDDNPLELDESCELDVLSRLLVADCAPELEVELPVVLALVED